MEPCKHSKYVEGESVVEELQMTSTEFRTAFKHIGIVYKSKKAFNKSEDKFQGKMYLSYYDRITKLTYYVRNNELVNRKLHKLEESQETGKAKKNEPTIENQKIKIEEEEAELDLLQKEAIIKNGELEEKRSQKQSAMSKLAQEEGKLQSEIENLEDVSETINLVFSDWLFWSLVFSDLLICGLIFLVLRSVSSSVKYCSITMIVIGVIFLCASIAVLNGLLSVLVGGPLMYVLNQLISVVLWETIVISIVLIVIGICAPIAVEIISRYKKRHVI